MTPLPALTRVTRMGFVNAWLVADDDGLILVDTTFAGGARTIRRAAEDLGAPITRIVLTHAHGDHVGSLDALAGDGIEVSISARDARLLERDRTPDPDEPADAKLRGGYPGTTTRPDRLLVPGDRVGPLEAVAAPGHTPGHMAFLDTRDRTLLCGDAYSALGGVAVPARPYPRFPLPALATWHRPTALATARALRALAPARLAAGHGALVGDPAAAMDAAITRAGA